jgi:Ca-activated chloride channel family protein
MGRTLLALLLLIALGGLAGAESGGDDAETETAKVPLRTARANAKGNKLIESGNFGEAAEVYREEALRRPENGVLQRNLAGALSRSQAMDEGLAAYGQALRFAEGPKEKAKALFDLGNALAFGGQVQPALETYASAMLLDPTDMDIKHNFEYLMKQAQRGDQQGDDQDPEQDNEESGENQEGQEEQEQPQPGEENEQGEQQPQPAAESDDEEQDQSMDPEDAKRLLDALLEEEKELQAERSRREQTQDAKVDKDW